jgi:hypothetical protein
MYKFLEVAACFLFGIKTSLSTWNSNVFIRFFVENVGYLREAQHRIEILAMNEFDFPFPRFDTLPREGAIILGW